MKKVMSPRSGGRGALRFLLEGVGRNTTSAWTSSRASHTEFGRQQQSDEDGGTEFRAPPSLPRPDEGPHEIPTRPTRFSTVHGTSDVQEHQVRRAAVPPLALSPPPPAPPTHSAPVNVAANLTCLVGRDRFWPIHFGPSLFDQFWPIQFWPKLVFQWFHVRSPFGWGGKPRKSGGPQGWRAQKFCACFFPLPLPFRFFCLSLVVNT